MKYQVPSFLSRSRRRQIRVSAFNPWLAASLTLLLAAASSQAANLIWDASGLTPATPIDGSGTWNTDGTNWSNAGSAANWVNANADTAVFGANNGAAETVTLGTAITVGGLTINNPGSGNYTIAGGGNTLTFGGTINPAVITSNANATISAPFAVSGSVTTLRKANAGVLTFSGGGGGGAYVRSGPATGCLFITDGTYAVAAVNFWDAGGNDGTTNGLVFQTGGTINASAKWDGRNKTSSYNQSGGTLAVSGSSIRGLGVFNASGTASATFAAGDQRIGSDNVAGSLSLNDTATVSFANTNWLQLVNGGGTNTTVGTVNLNGGTLTVAGLYHGGPATTSSFVNFNGGTLKANGGGSSFFNANALITVSIYGGGAIVDTNGLNIPINQPLLATTGNGVDSATVTAGGSGYTTAPSVTFSGGGGTGAKGYALINPSGSVTRVVVTQPGKDFTSAPTIAFGSGTATATATAALVNANGSLTKKGLGTLTLTGANTYTGATTVTAGTLMLTHAGLADTSTVNLSATATLNLNFSGNDVVAALFIDGVKMPNGLYGSAHASGRFAGSGVLEVYTLPQLDAYGSWESDNGIAGAGAAVDSNNDGIPNGIEFVIGGNPSAPNSDSNSLLQPPVVDANNLTFVFRRTIASAAFNPFVEYSSDLAFWQKAQAGVDGVTVTEEPAFYSTNVDRVTVTIPRSLATGSEFFARLQVNIP